MPDLTPFEEYPRVRKIAYRIYWVAIVCVGAVQIGFATQTGGVPQWSNTALAVLAYVGAYVGFQADQNTTFTRRSGGSPPGGG